MALKLKSGRNYETKEGIKMQGNAEIAEQLFKQGYNCSQSVIGAYCEKLGLDFEMAMRLSSSFGGGMGRLREVLRSSISDVYGGRPTRGLLGPTG